MRDHHAQSAAERLDRIVVEACLYLGISQAALEDRNRERDVALARQVTCYLLHAGGYSIAQIAVRFGRHHSTILHAVRRVEQQPSLHALAQDMVTTILPFVGEKDLAMPSRSQALSRLVLRSLFGLVDLRQVRAVRAYVLGALFCCERVDATMAASGLLVIAQQPAVRAAVEEALTSWGLSAYATLIPLHVRQAGMERYPG